jgi:hypothetical protein
MAKNKLINSGFWSDPFIEELTLQEKAMFLYFITNELVSLSGVYPITKKRICFDTEIELKQLEKTIKLFSQADKIFWVDNHIIVTNFLKYQKPNPKMMIAIKNEIFRFPKSILLFLKDKTNKPNSLYIGYPEIRKAIDTHLKDINININNNKDTKDTKDIEEIPDPEKPKSVPKINYNSTAEKIYSLYLAEIQPKLKTKQRSVKNIETWLNRGRTERYLISAFRNYKNDMPKDPQYRKNPANFYGLNEDYCFDFLPTNYGAESEDNQHAKEENLKKFRRMDDETLNRYAMSGNTLAFEVLREREIAI